MIDAFMAEKRAGWRIEPIPAFGPYEPFAYAAATQRSPLTGPWTFDNWPQCQHVRPCVPILIALRSTLSGSRSTRF